MSLQRHRDNKKSQAKEDHPKRNFYQNGMRYPDRWTKYGTIGRVMSGSKFIAFKTPLSDEFFIGKPETPFGLKDVVETVTAAGKKLGLVVDLTNTQRYYKAADWADFGVEYKKIFCPGHTIHTNTELIKEFVAFVSEFLSKNDNADLVIGVHCTHGLNRTGFLICQYLITKENWTAEDAVKAFEEARGHEIERWEYKATLLGWDPANKPEVAISPEPTKNEDSRKREKDESVKERGEARNISQMSTGGRKKNGKDLHSVDSGQGRRTLMDTQDQVPTSTEPRDRVSIPIDIRNRLPILEDKDGESGKNLAKD
ncbi:hypothetical protein FO519_003350 [Halicephalobus sp. NKZ332]|nr:hypothetical protein FO519_003350 [Halicephalobus sp. NKZ332]